MARDACEWVRCILSAPKTVLYALRAKMSRAANNSFEVLYRCVNREEIKDVSVN